MKPPAGRIVCASLALESSSFNPQKVLLGNFWHLLPQSSSPLPLYVPYSTIKLDGGCLPRPMSFLSKVCEGVESDVEFGFSHCYRGFTGGRVDKGCWEEILGEFKKDLEGWARKGVDGIYLDLHGGMAVEGVDDAEGTFVSLVRDVVGPSVLISASFDLHGNISRQLCNRLNMLTAYKTSPHVDIEQTKEKAMLMLIDALSNKETSSPFIYHVSLPLLISGEKALTTVEPSKSLYKSLENIEKLGGVLDASIFMGCPWTDVPHAGVSVTVTLSKDLHKDNIIQELKLLAESIWNHRNNFSYPPEVKVLPFLEAMEQILKHETAKDESLINPILLCDLGDNPCAGATSDVTWCLEETMKWVDSFPSKGLPTFKILIVAIWDEDLVKKCFEVGKGGVLTYFNLGRRWGVGDKDIKVPLVMECGLVMNTWEDQGAIGGRHALIEYSKNFVSIQVLLTQKRKAFMGVCDFMDIELQHYGCIILKSGFLSPELSLVLPSCYYCETPGAVDPHLDILAWCNIKRPIFPLDSFQFSVESCFSHLVNIK